MQQNKLLYLLLVSVPLTGCGEANNSDAEAESSPSSSAAANPDSEEPDSRKPDSTQPNPQKPNPQKPDSEKPDSRQPNSEEPHVEEPDPASADADKTVPEKPDPDRLDTAKSDSTDTSFTNSDSKSQAADSNSGADKAGRPINITFDDVKLDIKEDVVFKDSMLPDRVRELEGKHIRIRGFICAEATFKQKDIKEFILIKNNRCKFGPGGQFHHNMAVRLKPADAIDYTTRPVTVEGKLILKPVTGPNGKTWTLYHLEG